MSELLSKLTQFAGRFDGGFETLQRSFQYPFVRNALIVGVLIALCSSLLGVTLVLKRFSFIGDGLSHVAFGAMAVAAVAGLTNEMLVVLPITVIAAVLLLRSGRKARLAGDASLAMLSVGALGLGYLLMNLFSASGNISGDVCTTLFGATSILTLSKFEVWLCIGMSVFVIASFILMYNRIFSVTFDEVFATATGTRAGAYNLFIAVITAVIIVLAMNLVGSLLVSALVIFPAISAMRVFKRFRDVVVCSACVSVFCAAFGLLLSIPAQTPVGSTIVVVDLLVFFIFSLVGKIKKIS
ncbi:MAG: metal ABC transporter permease [Clostridia bacterium]|nr:metal ABC transporter permease [Clostridia bacterium]